MNVFNLLTVRFGNRFSDGEILEPTEDHLATETDSFKEGIYASMVRIDK